MAQLVLLQGLQVHKGLATYATGERGLASVGSQMSCKGAAVGKKSSTLTLVQRVLGASIRRVAGWTAFVVPLLLLLLLLLLTSFWLFLHALQFQHPPIPLLSFLGAKLARWRPVLGMSEFMAFQEGRSIEVSLAIRTFKGFDVGMSQPMTAKFRG